MKFFQELAKKATLAFKRFPLAMLWALAGSIHFLIAIGMDLDKGLFTTTYRLDITFILGISWLIGTQFFIEQFKKPKTYWWLKLVVLILLGFFYYCLPANYEDANTITYTRWFLLLLAGHVFIFFAPFIKTWNNSAYWNYLKTIVIAIGRSALFSGVLFAGLAFALVATDALFELTINDKIYGQLFVICLGVVNTCIYLSDFPKEIPHGRTLNFNQPLEVFIKFILIPLMVLYLLISYLYGFKILFSWELPQGWISTMVVVLALVGLLVQIMIGPIWQNHPSILIRKFNPWFYFLLLPLLILLFIAVFRRISDYNFTEDRYFLMILSFWILAMSGYFLFNKKKELRILPISLFLLILCCSFGPWGAFQISSKAQTAEFRQIFNKINPETNTLEENQADRLENIARYLAQRDRLGNLEPILGFDPEKYFPDDHYYTIGKKILDTLNVQVLIPQNEKILEEGNYYHFNRNEPLAMKLKGFTDFVEFRRPAPAGSEIALKSEGENLWIEQNKDTLLVFNIDRELMEILNKSKDFRGVDPKKFEFHFKNEEGNFMLIFTQLSVRIENHAPEIQNAAGYLFYKTYEDD